MSKNCIKGNKWDRVSYSIPFYTDSYFKPEGAPPPAEGAEPRDYPFNVLGLGNIVIPAGLIIRFMSKIDSVLLTPEEQFSYFGGATTFA